MELSKLILAIDTSCDDTSAAVTSGVTVLANIIASQTELHSPYGGVYPTVAKQAHQENIEPTIKLALKRARVNWSQISAVAVTQGPGLAPALEIGLAQAKKIASEKDLPIIPINHLEAHALSPLAVRRHRPPKKELMSWAEQLANHQLPALAIVVSGGHTEFIRVTQPGEYERLGYSIDDAAGEALDKVGRLLGLGYPAGPVIEKFAKNGDENFFKVPLPMTDREDFNMSFSGLKTWARNKLKELRAASGLTKELIFHFAASFQKGVFRHISYKLDKLLLEDDFREVWLGGGVATNLKLRQMIRESLKTYNKSVSSPKNSFSLRLFVPYEKRLCMDNAAMIGVAAGHKLWQQSSKAFYKNLEKLDRKPRWSIDQI